MRKKDKRFSGKPLLYIDLLGFSSDIMRQSLKDSLRYYDRFLDSLKSMTEIHKKLRFTFVSDTALLWIHGNNSTKNAEELFDVAFSLFHNSLFEPDESIRGSIVFDEFQISDHTFTIGKSKITSPIIVGKAIINAYRWEQTQNWLGISIHPSHIDTFKSQIPGLIDKLEKERVINLYNVPTKNGYIQTYAIGLHESHINGKVTFKSKVKKNLPAVEKIWKVKNYFIMLESKKENQTDLSALSKITETTNYITYLADKNLGKLYDWDNPFEQNGG